jgi:hypothetical protein
VEKVFHLNYERYKPACSRPLGMGPFFDFAAAVARRQKPAPKSSLWRFGRKAAPALVVHVDESEGRWYGEGGNTQTHVSRRAYKRL